jgi:uncharacterized membrane protein
MIFVLRLVHILCGAFWFGAVVFNALILMPSVRAAGPGAGPVLAQIGQRRVPMVMMGAALLTIGSGIWLMMLVSGGNMEAWMQTGMGRTLGTGGALAILTLVLGMALSAPAARRLAAITQGAAKRGGAPTPDEAAEIARLQKRMGVATVIVTVLLSLTVATMAVARYVR